MKFATAPTLAMDEPVQNGRLLICSMGPRVREGDGV